MSTRLNIPKGARLIEWHSATIPTGDHAGKTVHLRLYAGGASHGYTTDYQRIDHRWFEIEIPGAEWESSCGRKRVGWRSAWAHSGRNLGKAFAALQDNLRTLRSEGATPAVHVSESAVQAAYNPIKLENRYDTDSNSKAHDETHGIFSL